MPKISIIIPVYNVEKYLEKCLDSVVNQTFKDFEVICINDGSTDNSLNILKRYAAKDSRFRIIDKENEGVSKARNIGIETAQGDYIQFIDSDDWIEPNCLELVYEKISQTDSDMVIFSSRYIVDGKIISTTLKYAESYFKHRSLIVFFYLVIVCWDKIFKREFLINNNLKFPEEIFYVEDGIFNLQCLYKNPKIDCVPVLLYNYNYLREGCAMKKFNYIERDLIALKYLEKTEEFKNADFRLKVLTINRFCFFVRGAYISKNLENKSFAPIFIEHLKTNYDLRFLKRCREYNLLLETLKVPISKKILMLIEKIKDKLEIRKI